MHDALRDRESLVRVQQHGVAPLEVDQQFALEHEEELVGVVVDVPDVFSQAFVMEKDGQKFSKSGGWGYALFNYDAASDKFTVDPSPSDCGHSCHVAVKAKDHIFHPYQKR